MKSETSLNFMLVVFCVALIGFVLLNGKIADTLNEKQAALEKNVESK
jgi:preprotein translocase subunit SecG